MDNINGEIKELIKNERNNALKTHCRIWMRETSSRKRTQKTQNDYLFIPNLVHFLIHIILRGGITHYHI